MSSQPNVAVVAQAPLHAIKEAAAEAKFLNSRVDHFQ
jgi:hypothetical protein